MNCLNKSWLPTWLQNRPKSMPGAIQKPSEFASCFRCFLQFFWKFLCQLGTPESLKNGLSPRRRAHFAYFANLLVGCVLGTNLASIWVRFGDQVEAKLLKKTFQKKFSKSMMIGSDFLIIFVRFWLPTRGARGVKNRSFRYLLAAGHPLGAKMAPRWLRDRIFGPFSPPWALFYNNFFYNSYTNSISLWKEIIFL